MKKALIFCAAALLLALGACKEKEDPNKIDWDAVTVNGFYVAGPATGSDEIKGDCVMTAGFNEEGKSLREGMYEKYIVLEADKDFYLLFNDGGKKSRYSADLKLFETPLEEAYGDNPASVLKGALEVGEDAKPMRVSKTGLYHIVLDKNQMGDLNNSGGAQILLLDASAFQMIGAFGEAESDPAPASFSNDGVTFTFKDVKLMKDAWFKFRTGKYWKVTLDDAGKVKAEVSLGEGMSQNGGNLTVDKSGIYDVTLTFKLAGGGFDRSFSYKTEFKEAVAEFPEWAGIYGNYSGHNWNVDDAEPVKIGAKSGEEGTGVYKGVITMVGGTGFKVFADGAWLGGSMDNLGDGADLVMAEEGTFYVEINLKDSPKTIKFEKITSVGIIGDATSTGWSDETKLTYNEAARVFSGPVTFVEGGSFKIRFNENWDLNYGGTLDALKYVGDNIPGPGAGEQIVTLDFANDASIMIGAIAIDGDMSDWAGVASFASSQNSRIREWKFKADANNVYFYFALRKNRVDSERVLYIGFDTDNNSETGGEHGNLKGCDSYAKVVPFTNVGEATAPVPVVGLDAASEAGGQAGVVKCAAFDDGSDLSSNSSNIYLEISIPRSVLNLPAAGSNITVGCSYDWYVTGTQSIAL